MALPEVHRNQWFGEPWPAANRRAPVCSDDAYRVDVPLGQPCYMCEELIDLGDQGYTQMGIRADETAELLYCHRECMLRNVMGCLSSVMGGPHLHDRTDMTYRQEALLVDAWVSTHRDYWE